MARTEIPGRQIKDKSVSLADDVVDVLPVTNGGLGAATLASGSVLIGAGTNPVGVVFPGASGNLLASNGSTWVSAPPPTVVDDVAVVGDSFQFLSDGQPVGDPVSLLIAELDGGSPSSTSIQSIDGGML